MPKALVTGASGFLGWHVARLLSNRGYQVRALCRPSSQLRELDVERVSGDLRDPESLARAIAGCELVFHIAADYRLWSKNPQELYRSNVDGTRNILETAERAGTERIVYTSTVGCVGMRPGELGDENAPVSIDDMTGHYKRSKWLAEQVALEKARNGLPIIIVNPTAPIGDHDWKPTPTGKIVLDFLRGRMPGFVDTGLNVVDAEDTAKGHLLAAERGRPGERYILGSENLTLQQILLRVASIAGKRAPTFKVPYALAYAVGAVSTAFATATGKEPIAPLEGVKMARKKMFVTYAKAERELGFCPAPAEVGLNKAVSWFRSNGYC
ncbi:MAG: NAD-dependent epimerase/dehydratase family protein [Acidobacteriaceae bacterium]|nr:NAD-dependent epimerase/dehydratase family protein [Acidobacteriaceae bacterium]